MNNVLLLLIALRPFVASLAYPCADAVLNSCFLAALLVRFLLHPEARRLPPASVSIPLWAFLASVAAAALWAQDRSLGALLLPHYGTAAGLFLYASTLDARQRQSLLRVIVGTGVLISLLALYQYFFSFRHTEAYLTQQGMSADFARDYLARRRVFFPFVTPNVLAGYLGMIAFLAAGMRRRWLLLPPVIAALILTQSIGAFISCAIIAVVFALRARTHRRNAVILITVTLLAVFLAVWRRTQTPAHQQPAFSTVMRLDYWQETWAVIAQHPWRGTGLGNFNLTHSRYAHNVFLQLWAEGGIITLLAFVCLVTAVFTRTYRQRYNTAQPQLLPWLCAAAGVFLLHNMLDFSFFLPEVSALWWSICAPVNTDTPDRRRNV